MKNYLLLATCALALLLVSCKKDEDLERPTITIVNGTNYEAWLSIDNVTETWCVPGGNKKTELSCSINIPTLVVVEFYDSKYNYIKRYTWDNYKFNWNSSYKMTLTNNSSTSRLIKI